MAGRPLEIPLAAVRRVLNYFLLLEKTLRSKMAKLPGALDRALSRFRHRPREMATKGQQPLQETPGGAVVSPVGNPGQPLGTGAGGAVGTPVGPQHTTGGGTGAGAGSASPTPGTLRLALQNNSSSSTVYAYVTGQAIDNGNALFLLQADGRTYYYPSSPASPGTQLAFNVAIPLGAPGNKVTVNLPKIAGGRIWFSIGTPLVFLLNPGPGLVEPSVTNPTDPNINTNWSFCEFTYNDAQLFANISYVDFVGLPVALTLTSSGGGQQHVSGMPQNGVQEVANQMIAQSERDGRRWRDLIVFSNGAALRVLSPNNGIVTNPDWFETYWTDYVNTVFAHYRSSSLTIDTQASFGNVTGQVNADGLINYGGAGEFAKPTARDIFSCSTGPFATGSNMERNAVIPRLAAAFNRSTLLMNSNQPDSVTVPEYYEAATTNHYARIVHAVNVDGHGYAFPYDDVTPTGGVPQEGAVMSGTPTLFTVTVGGTNAFAG